MIDKRRGAREDSSRGRLGGTSIIRPNLEISDPIIPGVTFPSTSNVDLYPVVRVGLMIQEKQHGTEHVDLRKYGKCAEVEVTDAV